MTATISRTIHVAHSPDADDAFMFWAMAQGKIDTGDRRYVHELGDIESLNRRALAGELEVTAVSLHAYRAPRDRYPVLAHGASIGDRYGPLIVSRKRPPTRPRAALTGRLVAVPGELTTAFLTLRLYQPAARHVVVPFDQIEDYVAAGKADAGLLIHEGQLTFAGRGLHLWADMGEWWYQQTQLPSPLGGNVVRRDLGDELTRAIARDLKASIEYGLAHRAEALAHAQRKYRKQQQFEVFAASSADEALQQLRLHKVALMLSDIRMPGTSGVDLVPQALEIEPDLAILMLTAVNDATSAALCMQRGAMDYLTKPIELADLGRAVQRALKRREMHLENRHLNQWLKEEVTTRTAELHRERHRLERISTATLEVLVNALEAKDPYLRGHSARVADLSANIATEMGLREEEIDHIRMAGRLHDLGKIGTRDAVVNKEGPLTPDEFEHVKQHVIIGAQILAPLAHLGHIVAMVKSHHERWDGTGYPDGLRGEEVPLGGRIIGAAEVYDALTTARPYQEKMTPEQAVERMADLSGTVLDPKVYDALVRIVGRRQTLVFLDEDVGPAL